MCIVLSRCRLNSRAKRWNSMRPHEESGHKDAGREVNALVLLPEKVEKEAHCGAAPHQKNTKNGIVSTQTLLPAIPTGDESALRPVLRSPDPTRNTVHECRDLRNIAERVATSARSTGGAGRQRALQRFSRSFSGWFSVRLESSVPRRHGRSVQPGLIPTRRRRDRAQGAAVALPAADGRPDRRRSSDRGWLLHRRGSASHPAGRAPPG
jgi:hypothetical protein